MGFKAGNITKLKKRVGALNKQATKLNVAYQAAVNKEHQNNLAYAAAKRKEEAEKGNFTGGSKRFFEIAEGKGAAPTAAEMKQIEIALAAGDEAMEIGGEIPVFQNATARAHREYSEARQAYNDALAFLQKYLAEKDTYKAMEPEDYKAWKDSMGSAIAKL